MDFLTVGMPVWNDPDSVEKSVMAITRSTAWTERLDSKKELIVCVNGCTGKNDATLIAVNRLKKRVPRLKVFVLKAKGRNLAINFIARNASRKSKTIFFCDADVLVTRDAISRVLEALKSHPHARFAGAAAMPMTSLVPEKYRDPLRAYFLERAKKRLASGANYISGAGYAVDRYFFLRHPLPSTNHIADDLFINENFGRRIVLVRNARLFYLLPSAVDTILQRARYIVQEREQGVKKVNRPSLVPEEQSRKVKQGLLLRRALGGVAQLLVKVHPRIGWKSLGSTKLKRKK